MRPYANALSRRRKSAPTIAHRTILLVFKRPFRSRAFPSPASGRSVRLTRCYLRSVGAQGRPSRREEAFTPHARTNASDDIAIFLRPRGAGTARPRREPCWIPFVVSAGEDRHEKVGE